MPQTSNSHLSALLGLLDQAPDHPLLTPAEEVALAKRVERGDKAATERIVLSNLRLVVFIARRYQGQGVPLEDLVQEGVIGPGHIQAELGDVLRGTATVDRAGRDWTIFKSLGIAIEDLASANHVLRKAEAGNIGLVTDLDDPKVAGVSFVDHSAGIFAAHGIMAALLARVKTGRGQFIDVSLLQVAIAFIESHVADYLNGGEAVSRENFPKGRIYSLLDCAGKPFMVHLSSHNQAWEGLLRAGELDELIGDPRFASNKHRTERHEEIVRLLRAQFRTKEREYWLARLDAHHACFRSA